MKKIALSGGFAVVFVLGLTYGLVTSSQVVPAAAQAAVEIPFMEKWAASGHADRKAAAFNDWNEAEPKEVPVTCAKCHSTPGYRDFLGVDGSPAEKVDKPAPPGTVIECMACHNEVTVKMNSVVMPSGVKITGLGKEARCLQCHQGRESKLSVDQAIEKIKLADSDTVSKEPGFIDIHWFAAAVTQYGTVAKGGYEYSGKSYDAKFAHVDQFSTCLGCHDAHTLKVRVEECGACHAGIKSVEDLKKIRMQDSLADYDGDGDVKEGLAAEINGLQEILYRAIQTYATEKSKTPIAYDAANSPYFFIDTDQNGKADADEAKRENKYNAWTARLLKAAYNYQVSVKDPGAFAHGGKYIIQLLSDSIADVNAALPTPIDVKATHRDSAAHFAGGAEAFRHWDKEGEVPGFCSKCHSAGGLRLFLKEGVTISQPPADGFKCTTCHADLQKFTRVKVAKVKFPSGAEIDSKDADTNICMSCHQGRESTLSVNNASKGLDADTVAEKLRFLNVHYFAVGATRFGTEAKGAYEYEGKTYVGFFSHVEDYVNCTSCHDAHGLNVELEKCAACHAEAGETKDFRKIRMDPEDYDGDGKTDEGIAEEIETLQAALYGAIQEYAKTVVKTAIVYDAHNAPYFFTDLNNNGQAEPEELKSDNGYKAWTPRLLRAAYNYQYGSKDPGGFAHNSKYIMQILHDSLSDLGTRVSVNMAKMVRP